MTSRERGGVVSGEMAGFAGRATAGFGSIGSGRSSGTTLGGSISSTGGRPRVRIQDAKGTLVGFRFPEHLRNATEPALTFHYLSGNLQRGGRVAGFIMQEGTIEIDVCNQFHLIQPDAAGEDGGIVVVPSVR